MSEEPFSEEEWHRKTAVNCFNKVWDLLEKKSRIQKEEDTMIHAAHASRFHWGEIGTPLEYERGEWQISRVYAVLDRAEPAMYHAKRCLEICTENNIGDFDLAFAYEAMARAHGVAGETTEVRKFVDLAKKAGEHIEKEDDKTYFFDELNTINNI
ncbi:MAG: hypothetical protein HXS53_13045 [Theionarchaea archaeon]|nr:hypothetical protein [Theionarchaea archaeon]